MVRPQQRRLESGDGVENAWRRSSVTTDGHTAGFTRRGQDGEPQG